MLSWVRAGQVSATSGIMHLYQTHPNMSVELRIAPNCGTGHYSMMTMAGQQDADCL